MGLLSRLLGDESESEPGVEKEPDEEKGDEPETETVWSIDTNATETRTRKTAEVEFASGRTKEITYYGYDQTDDDRVYKTISDYTAKLNAGFKMSYPTIEYDYEVVREVPLHNVETIKVTEEVEETFSSRLDFEVKESQLWQGVINYFEDNEDAESFEREVNNETSE